MSRAAARGCIAGSLVLALSSLAAAFPSDSLDLHVGDRVRIGDRYGRYVYLVRGEHVDSLLVEPVGTGRVRTMALRDVSSIEVGKQRSRAGGILGGTSIGVVALAAACTVLMDGEDLRDEGPAYMAAGGVLGGAIGMLRPGIRWKQVYWGGPTKGASMASQTPVMFDSTGADVVVPQEGLRIHYSIGAYAGYDKENAPGYERSHFRYVNELGLKYLQPFPSIERIESVAIAYSFSVGETSYETRHSVGPTVSFRMNDRWSADVMAGPLWFRSTNDFGVGFQCRGYFLYRKVISCEALLNAAPPSDEYEAAGGEWQTSLYTGVGVHGRPAGGVLLGEVILAATWVLGTIVFLSAGGGN